MLLDCTGQRVLHCTHVRTTVRLPLHCGLAHCAKALPTAGTLWRFSVSVAHSGGVATLSCVASRCHVLQHVVVCCNVLCQVCSDRGGDAPDVGVRPGALPVRDVPAEGPRRINAGSTQDNAGQHRTTQDNTLSATEDNTLQPRWCALAHLEYDKFPTFSAVSGSGALWAATWRSVHRHNATLHCGENESTAAVTHTARPCLRIDAQSSAQRVTRRWRGLSGWPLGVD